MPLHLARIFFKRRKALNKAEKAFVKFLEPLGMWGEAFAMYGEAKNKGSEACIK